MFKMFAEDKEAVKFLKDEIVESKLAKAKKLSEVKVTDYDAVFYIGGHGPVLDLASDPVNAKLASEVCLHLRP
jgi:putative intracellular protease/amidase